MEPFIQPCFFSAVSFILKHYQKVEFDVEWKNVQFHLLLNFVDIFFYAKFLKMTGVPFTNLPRNGHQHHLRHVSHSRIWITSKAV